MNRSRESTASLSTLATAAGELVARIDGDPATAVAGLSLDSRAVARGDLFFCVPGATADGHAFAGDAAAAGAAALCVERATGVGVPEIVVSDVRRAMGRMAASFYGRPADELLTLGVTGTNGKTTTAFLLEAILTAAGRRPGLIGTVYTRWDSTTMAGVRTTPESLHLQAILADMLADGIDSVAMEVTSHGLTLHRVEGVRFDAAAFTNLSQDHLDFHPSMEDYYEAKLSLFDPARLDRGAVNIDDAYGRRLAEESPVEMLSFGLAGDADVRADDIGLGPHGSRFLLLSPAGEAKIETSLAGAFNLSNCLAAAATALQAGIGIDAIASGLASLQAVPGRFESVDEGQPFAVVVDYAHTPDSLDNVLGAAGDLVSGRDGRIICVFGCGGDRDRSKRPLMGAVVAERADYVVVTSDNPRSEEPAAIIEDIVGGVRSRRREGPDAVIVDRADAISHALGIAGPGDAVVIAGKGHETGQQFKAEIVPFDDRVVARAALNYLGWIHA
ncbi:MAG: UDP-N-acetylmuramoyl-L-alanyl-D-glutamate--2,6-diaminopimelate ligase [Actinomycetota bacterium]